MGLKKDMGSWVTPFEDALSAASCDVEEGLQCCTRWRCNAQAFEDCSGPLAQVQSVEDILGLLRNGTWWYISFIPRQWSTTFYNGLLLYFNWACPLSIILDFVSVVEERDRFGTMAIRRQPISFAFILVVKNHSYPDPKKKKKNHIYPLEGKKKRKEKVKKPPYTTILFLVDSLHPLDFQGPFAWKGEKVRGLKIVEG